MTTMKKMFTLAVLMTMAITASAMTYNEARNEALFLSDKMAYELGLTDTQYDAVYEINLDYLMSIGSRNDFYGKSWSRRNSDLRYVLTAWQYDNYMMTTYFYRPLNWVNGRWSYGVYSHYTAGHLMNARPKVFITYRGGVNRPNDHYAHLTISKPAAPKNMAAKPATRTATGKPVAAKPVAAKPTTTMHQVKALPTSRRTGTIR